MVQPFWVLRGYVMRLRPFHVGGGGEPWGGVSAPGEIVYYSQRVNPNTWTEKREKCETALKVIPEGLGGT